MENKENLGPTTQPNKAASAGLAGNNGKRKTMLVWLGVGVIAASAAYAAYYFGYSRYHEETDDAYVSGNLVQLTSQVAGSVVTINADDTQIVKAGEPLIQLDRADAKVDMIKAEAALAQAVQQVSTLYVNNGVYEAQIAQRHSDLARAEDDLKRRLSVGVADSGAVSAEDMAHARAAVTAAKAGLQVAQEQLASNHAQTGKTSVAQHPNVIAAAGKVRESYLNYARNTLPAPVTGYVAKRAVQLGQRVAPGTPLMAIVPLDGVWVDANFKETQVRHIRIGQDVTLHADVYGGDIEYHGKVVGFSAGTGSAFATLPAQNATGNWIKVVQRLPVRIQLDAEELRAHPLRVGLSMQVDVATRKQDGTELAAAKNASYQTRVFDNYAQQADAEIDRIIKQNRIGS
ncbi:MULTISPECIES: HlyD family efflux transporter periplasmic adaptor subunit [unclassified Herbaspirillum]|uniref:HlyD family efflux transporter periplasmic adaptor subunit n=1 Tax=unclassified Herbaspirillum TaxID=2624150 RepID=UPI00383AC32E